jgi:hypothetical protein
VCHQQLDRFLAEGIYFLVRQWDVCLNANGEDFNGLYAFAQNNLRSSFIPTPSIIFLGTSLPTQP